MGWSEFIVHDGETLEQAIRASMYASDPSATIRKVVGYQKVGRDEIYIALEEKEVATGTIRVRADVIVCRHPRAEPNGDRRYLYKGVPESWGPAEKNCPERILNMLTPTMSVEAIKWRAECEQRNEVRKKLRFSPGDKLIADPSLKLYEEQMGGTLVFVEKRKAKYIFQHVENARPVSTSKEWLLEGLAREALTLVSAQPTSTQSKKPASAPAPTLAAAWFKQEPSLFDEIPSTVL